MLVNVKIHKDDLLEMLLNRLEEAWTKNKTIYKLYETMYESYIDGGCFDGAEFNPMVIVDNDYVNYCDVISEGDEAYDNIKKLYDEQGCGDISCEHELNHGWNFIEAEYEGSFLVRY